MQAKAADSTTDSSASNEELELLEAVSVAGVNHRTAPVELREKLAIPKGGARTLLDQQADQFGLSEVVALSTCNRTEFYWAGGSDVVPPELFACFPEVGPDGASELEPSVYVHRGREAARHLFNVACGLDSLVWGETQILHQVKKAYERSREETYTGSILNLLFQKTFQVAKEVHTRTRIGAQRASVPSVALELAKAIFEDLSEVFVLVVGTGEIAQLTFDAMLDQGAERYGFVSRTAERAREWGERHNAETWTLEQLPEVLPQTDILVACTSSTEPVISAEAVKSALSARPGLSRPLLILDLGLPRNVEESVSELEQVYLHDVDDLQEVVERSKAQREKEAAKAEIIVAAALEDYDRECRARTASAVIKQIRANARQMGDAELDRSLNRLPDLSPEQRDEVGVLVHRVLGKLLHSPTKALNRASKNGSGREAVDWARQFFGLNDEED